MTQAMSRVALYAAVGPELTHYEVDVAAGTLTRRGDVQLPANVQYAWPHASGHLLYAGCSNAATGRGIVGSDHSLIALAIDPASGALSPCGDPIALPTRPIHLTTDIASEHVLVALTNPSRVQVYRTNPDGSLGGQVHQTDEIAAGSYAHQVRIRPNNRTAILTDRGLGAAGGSNPPGCLRLFDYAGGTLTRGVVVAPSGDHGFGPRHLDFHPTQPWAYVVLEPQHRIAQFAFDRTTPHLVCERSTLTGPGEGGMLQAASTVHVHPNGQTVYVANRASSTTSMRSEGVAVGGENTSRCLRSIRGAANRCGFSLSMPPASTAAPFRSIRPVGSSSRLMPWARWHRMEPADRGTGRAAFRCSASPITARSASCASTTSRWAPASSSGWE